MEKVIKRDGRIEEVDFNKILERIKSLCHGLNTQHVNAVKVAKMVIQGVYDMVPTSELDTLAVKVAGGLNVEHPDYGLLAGRISASNLQKQCPKTFTECVERLYNYKKGPLVSEEFYQYVTKHGDALDAMVVHEKDFTYNVFSMETLKRSYLLRCGDEIIETPQYMNLRIATFLNMGKSTMDVKFTYDALSDKKYTHASPTMFNAGAPRAQMASCFLLKLHNDSIQGIYKTLSDCAQISKHAGGIGLSFHEIRSSGSYIAGNGGKADGIVPALKVYNETSQYVTQASKRKGSFAVYLEPHHADIMDFLQLRLPGGAEERRTRDLFTAMWLSDLFFERVKAGGKWSLFDPNTAPGLNQVFGDQYVKMYEKYEDEGRAVQVIPAQKVWDAIVTSVTESGTPYLLNKDQANRMSNQRNLGVIQSSNLCVAPETPMLTSKGYIPIADLKDQQVDVWNGEEWSSTTVRQTGENQKLIKVVLSNGTELACTPYHKFCVETGTYPTKKSCQMKVEAQCLTVGQKLIKHDLPDAIENPTATDFPYAYTHGFFCGDGTVGYTQQGLAQPRITLYGEKKDLVEHIDYKSSSLKETANGTINLHLHNDIPVKFSVPNASYSVQSRLEWFAGFADADGCVSSSNTNGKVNETLQIVSVHKDFLHCVMLMLQEMGISSKVCDGKKPRKELLPGGHGGKRIYDCKQTWRLLVSAKNVQKLLQLKWSPQRLVFPLREYSQDVSRYVTVKAVIDEGRVDDTFCFTEPKRNMGMFNGVLSMNCAEIIEYSSDKESAVCNLASINLSSFVNEDKSIDYDGLANTASLAVRNLNTVIDKSYYPTEETKRSNQRHRPLGLGVSGLADVFFKVGVPFDSEQARDINRNMFEAMYYGSVRESAALSAKDGPYPSYASSPASLGLLQFDMWRSPELNPGVTEELRKELDSTLGWEDRWTELKHMVKNCGLRNSLLTAIMPTASSASIIGSNECVEPITSNIYSRAVLSGEFTIVNKYLVAELDKLGLWNQKMSQKIIANDGSVQGIEGIPPGLQETFKTVWEISQKAVIDMSFHRSQFVDQSQSLNLFMRGVTKRKYTSMMFYAWARRLKTMQYYLRSQSATQAVKFTVKKQEEEECLGCSA